MEPLRGGEQAPTDPAPSFRHRRSRRLTSLLSKVALELFIVFVAVSAAFAVEDYRDKRAEDHRREAVYRALDRELRHTSETHGPRFVRDMANQLDAWDRAVAAGQQPVPPSFRLAGAEGPPTGVWNAAMATGSIELVEPELFYEMARYYNRAQTASILYQRYSSAAQTEIWPYLEDGPGAFWDDSGQPKPAVNAHVQRLRDFRDRARANSIEARQLRKKLARVLPD